MSILQAVVVIALAPMLQGILQWLRARLCGRPGPPPVQPYRELRKLFSKEAVVAAQSSWLVLAAPGIALGASLALAFIVPAFSEAADLDVFALVMTLALARFVLVLAAIDSRAAFGGMAASREMFFAALGEAPLILAIVAAALTGSVTAQILAAAAIVLVVLAETARIPVDNQETHYELTMIHEGLVLDYSGWQLALLHAAAYVRQAVLLMLAAAFMPGGPAVFPAWFALVLAGVALIERRFAKLRLFEVPQLLASAALLAVMSIGIRIAVSGPW